MLKKDKKPVMKLVKNSVKKPWGDYLILEKYPDYWLKKLSIRKGEELSLQNHKNRSEIWVVLRGKVKVQKGENFFILEKGDHVKINKKEKHRIHGLSNAIIMEAAFGQPREKDIKRYQDKYGRAK
mgnify:CR=1 FL=1